MNGGGGVSNKEDDDGGDDEDQQEDGDTERLLLVGGLQLALHCYPTHNSLPVRFSTVCLLNLHKSLPQFDENIPQFFSVVEGCGVVLECLVWVWILPFLQKSQ